MSRKNNLLSYKTMSAVAVSSTNTYTSAVTNTQFLDNIGYQFNFSGSPTGTFSLQVSADYAQDFNGNVQNAGNWAPLVFTYWDGTMFVTSETIPTSVGSPIYLDLALLSAPWIRAVYTNASGTGTVTAIITAKEI